MENNNEFFIHVSETEKRLFVSRPASKKSGAFSPCDMTPDDVDYEMASGKHPEILEICGMMHWLNNIEMSRNDLFTFGEIL